MRTPPSSPAWAAWRLRARPHTPQRAPSAAQTPRAAQRRLLSGSPRRCGHRLGSYDAVVAGEVYATKPVIFGVLARLFAQSIASTIAGAMQVPAAQVRASSHQSLWGSAQSL